MPAIAKHLAVHLSLLFSPRIFSPAVVQCRPLRFGCFQALPHRPCRCHAFVLTQAALEVEAEKPLASQQRINLRHDLTLVAEVLESGKGPTETTSSKATHALRPRSRAWK